VRIFCIMGSRAAVGVRTPSPLSDPARVGLSSFQDPPAGQKRVAVNRRVHSLHNEAAPKGVVFKKNIYYDEFRFC